MKFLDKIPYLIIAGFAWIIIVSSCANQGMPSGGPRDSIPPVLVSTSPRYKSLNFGGDEVRLTFNEFIIPDQVSEQLVISPPIEKRPTILMKSKTLIVRFPESLQDSMTYSLDFKNSVVDNNEQNPIEDLRFIFSTGDELDSLRVAGNVMNAFNMEPLENVLVLLHKNLHDSAVYTLLPDYIARTDEEGMYLFDNLDEGKYHVFSLND
ncbi:MAG: Ig-like domain-containing domain, partial [Prolixibacteraceae bacterium]